jgi:hypothetical protein
VSLRDKFKLHVYLSITLWRHVTDVRKSPKSFCLPDCWLEVRVHPKGPATGHHNTGFLGFPLSLSKCWDGSQVATACFSCSPPNLNSWKLSFIAVKATKNHFSKLYVDTDRLCGLVVRVSGYRSRGPGFDSRSYQFFWEVGGLERGPLSLVTTTEELLEWRSSSSGLENRD